MREENLRRLTKKQLAVYDKVKSYIEMTGVSPTLEELRQMLSVQSLNSVLQHLDVLEGWGLITRHRYQQRSIELMTPEQASRGSVVLPVIASAGCDAMTVFAQQAFDDYLTKLSTYAKGLRHPRGVSGDRGQHEQRRHIERRLCAGGAHRQRRQW